MCSISWLSVELLALKQLITMMASNMFFGYWFAFALYSVNARSATSVGSRIRARKERMLKNGLPCSAISQAHRWKPQYLTERTLLAKLSIGCRPRSSPLSIKAATCRHAVVMFSLKLPTTSLRNVSVPLRPLRARNLNWDARASVHVSFLSKEVDDTTVLKIFSYVF